MGFEKFINSRYRKPRCSIRATGQIGFNASAIKEFGLEGMHHAVLYYDAEKQLIAIEPCNALEEGAKRVVYIKSNMFISARGMLAHFGIAHDKGRSYNAALNHNWIIIDLNDEVKK